MVSLPDLQQSPQIIQFKKMKQLFTQFKKMAALGFAIMSAVPICVGLGSGFLTGLFLPSLKWSVGASILSALGTNLYLRRLNKIKTQKSIEVFDPDLINYCFIMFFGYTFAISVVGGPIFRIILIHSVTELYAAFGKMVGILIYHGHSVKQLW